MKRYGNLYNKICDYKNLLLAHKNAQKGKKHYKEIKMVNANPELYIKKIQEMLINETYKPSKYREIIINDKGKERLVAKLPYYPDRIIHWAILLILEPLFIKTFIKQTYSAIPNRGILKALKDTRKYIKPEDYVMKLDVRKYYNNIDHEILKKKLSNKFKDKKLLNLLFKIIDSYDKGVPIGNYTSQYFANFFLNDIDHLAKEKLKLHYYRYMDDITLIGSKEELINAYKTIKYEVEKIKLKLHPYLLHTIKNHKIDFVGYVFDKDTIRTRKRINENFKRATKNLKHKINKNTITMHSLSRYYSLLGWCKSGGIKCKDVMKQYQKSNLIITTKQG